MMKEGMERALRAYAENKYRIDLFRRGVVDYFNLRPELNKEPLPIIHSIKSRLKDPQHLADKIGRKWAEDPVDDKNLFQRITDLAGVRVLHLYPQQFTFIHSAIEDQVQSGEWYYREQPKAYTWDPEATKYFESLNIECLLKESYYTSIHYLIQPRKDSDIVCELQVRTLFEEIWGEIDHYMNYPYKTESVACKEQLRVLGKLASTGTRLADAIMNSLDEHNSIKSILEKEQLSDVAAQK